MKNSLMHAIAALSFGLMLSFAIPHSALAGGGGGGGGTCPETVCNSSTHECVPVPSTAENKDLKCTDDDGNQVELGKPCENTEHCEPN